MNTLPTAYMEGFSMPVNIMGTVLDSSLVPVSGADVYIIEDSFSIPEDTNVLLIPASRYSYSIDELEEIARWFSEAKEPRLLWVAGDSDFFREDPYYPYYFTPDARIELHASGVK